MKKVVFIITSKYDIFTQLNLIRDYRHQSNWQTVVIVVGSYDAQQICKKYHIPFKTTIHYLTTEMHKRVSVESLKFAKGWYKNPEIEKTLSHRGISLCELMDYDFYLFFSGFFLYIELYQALFENEKPEKIVMTKQSVGYENFIVSLLSDKKGITVDWITQVDENSILKGKKLETNTLRRYISFIKEKIYTAKFLNMGVEIRYGCQLLWHLCVPHWFDRYTLKTFAQKKRKIVFAGGLRVANGLADYLRKDSLNGVVCLKLPNSKQRLITILPNIDLESFSTPEIKAIVKEKREIFMKILENKDVLDHFENTFCYKDFMFYLFMKKKLENIFGVDIPLMVYGMELIEEMDKRVGLDIFVSSSDQNPMIRGIMKTLQLRGKKNLVYLHAVDFFGNEVSDILGKCFVPIVADKIATWGSGTRDWFINQGVSPDRIKATSCSSFDNYVRVLNYPKKSICRFMGIPIEKNIIMYGVDHGNRESFHPYYVETRDEVLQHLKEVIKEISNFSELYLIVSPHPGDGHPEEIEHIVKDEKLPNIIFNPKLSLPYLLRISDILITHGSSTAVEAMIFNNNIIVYNPSGRPEIVPYVRGGVALRVEEKEDLVPTILELLNNKKLQMELDKKRKKFVRYFAGSIDGNATRNIADLIKQMIDN